MAIELIVLRKRRRQINDDIDQRSFNNQAILSYLGRGGAALCGYRRVEVASVGVEWRRRGRRACEAASYFDLGPTNHPQDVGQEDSTSARTAVGHFQRKSQCSLKHTQ